MADSQQSPALDPDLAEQVAQDVRRALAEDVGAGDLTAHLIPTGTQAQARVVTREAAVVCGRPWVDAVYRALDPAVVLEWVVAEGESVVPGQTLLHLGGPARSLLTGERTALNFLQTLSGTATRSARYVAAVAGTRARVLDTRKTLPGLRRAQKYAVRTGGGHNHRQGLYDAILIKENHITAAGGIGAAVAAARANHPAVSVEVEVENLAELDQALAATADIIMLDNFDLETLATAVAHCDRRCPLEASGNVSLETIGAIAATGVDYISVGALTKDVTAVDLSLRLRTL